MKSGNYTHSDKSYSPETKSERPKMHIETAYFENSINSPPPSSQSSPIYFSSDASSWALQNLVNPEFQQEYLFSDQNTELDYFCGNNTFDHNASSSPIDFSGAYKHDFIIGTQYEQFPQNSVDEQVNPWRYNPQFTSTTFY